MTRIELLKILVGKARDNGFEFRRWYVARLGVPWISADAAFALLESQRRYSALLFSHEFASAFWKSGEDITFQVAAQSFERVLPDGSKTTVHRKSFTRRSSRRDAWRYHLREMALAEEPLRYLRKYLAVEEEQEEEQPTAALQLPRAKKAVTKKQTAKPLPKGLPEFLRRPYKG
jgi:hypothetical protein